MHLKCYIQNSFILHKIELKTFCYNERYNNKMNQYMWRYNDAKTDFVNDFDCNKHGNLKHIYDDTFWYSQDNTIWIQCKSNPKYVICLSLLRVYSLIVKHVKDNNITLSIDNVFQYVNLFNDNKYKCIDECEYCDNYDAV